MVNLLRNYFMNNTTTTKTRPAMQGKPMSREQLRRVAPAIFARTCDPKVTKQYQFVSTEDILAKLAERGFQPVAAGQNQLARNNQWAFHQVRLQHTSATFIHGIEDKVRPQVVLVNSHDRTRRLTVMAGFFRLICSNGVIAPLVGKDGESLAMNGRVLHLKNLNPERLIDNAIKAIDRGTEVIKAMSGLKLTRRVQLKFTRAALTHVYGTKYAEKLEVERWLIARRNGDKGDALWTVFNRVQENIITGGVVLRSGRKTRALGLNAPATGAMSQVRFNEFLWNQAVALLN